ncbi:type II secretion system GspH family protein [Nostoc sp. FACHB-888]|uniref:type II secretion system GspH family protein n=1 Tax=Nostoc sp. FACHB-888 TaxID=2692842 RepID=UPI00168233C9|nr:type II secretion system GspH family protein [Nostoc sp. FACHB-888]MBD2242605.1 type II secretion system protein [Nostoc sp. FACHB-888]
MLPINSYSHLSRQLKTYLELKKIVAKLHPEQGFTIIESLMAIIVITVTLVAITPPIFLVVATRVQNQKSEQVRQFAQLEIDKVRLLAEKGIYANTDLPPSASATANVETVDAPTSFSSSTCTTFTADVACPVYTDNISQPSFYVQKFRTKEISNGTQIVAFQMGVRVYSSLSKDESGLQKTQASLKFTTGTGNQRKFPLAVMYTAVARSDLRDSLTQYKRFLCLKLPKPSSCP